MHILITNDDGVMAPGIMALANAFSILGKVTVVAPESEMSGVSQQRHEKEMRLSNRDGFNRLLCCSGTLRMFLECSGTVTV